MHNFKWVWLVMFFSAGLLGSALSRAQDLPVIIPDYPPGVGNIRNPFTLEQLHNITGPSNDGMGLHINLNDSSLQGDIYTGPYPFEAGETEYDTMRFRIDTYLERGEGTLSINSFFQDKYNANNWPEGQEYIDDPITMNIAYRLHLSKIDGEKIARYGFYDNIVSFVKTAQGYDKNLTILEGPYVTSVSSEDPNSVTFVWYTDQPSNSTVKFVQGPYQEKEFSRELVIKDEVTYHEVKIEDLNPDTYYHYYVKSEKFPQWARSSVYHFKTAPKPGEGEVAFAYSCDSREGISYGEEQYMGHNAKGMSYITNHGYWMGADFFIFSGDLVNGYTSELEDFRIQLKGWKQSYWGFWHTRPVYTAMGNHDSLLNVFVDGTSEGLSLDKWPYETSSAEALFAQEFYNPTNSPFPSDSRRPQYLENVYKFQYGPVLCIAFNNNYWWTTNSKCVNYGGSPEGYIMEDQLSWIENVLTQAENNNTIRFIVLYAQEPVFPCGGHLSDAMWWNGNNNIRAYTQVEGEIIPSEQGIIEVRNRLWKAVAQSSKVAAVCVGDEHAYYRLLVDSSTPVGVYPKDDLNGDGILDQYSPNSDFTYPVWQLTAGNAGAPFSSVENAPWQPAVNSSNYGYIFFKVNGNKLSMTAFSDTGILDYVDDLMAMKK